MTINLCEYHNENILRVLYITRSGSVNLFGINFYRFTRFSEKQKRNSVKLPAPKLCIIDVELSIIYVHHLPGFRLKAQNRGLKTKQ